MNPNLGIQEYLRTTDSSWGSETYLQVNSDVVVKILHFHPKSHTPYCYHLHRSKSLYVGYGKFMLRCVNPKTGILLEKLLMAGYQYKIDPGVAHQIELLDNEGHMIETSKPYYSDDLFLLADNIISKSTMDDLSRPSFR